MVAQLHHLLLELIPGGAKKDLSAAQAKALLAKVRPRDAAGKARRRVAAELTADLERIWPPLLGADERAGRRMQVGAAAGRGEQGLRSSAAPT